MAVSIRVMCFDGLSSEISVEVARQSLVLKDILCGGGTLLCARWCYVKVSTFDKAMKFCEMQLKKLSATAEEKEDVRNFEIEFSRQLQDLDTFNELIQAAFILHIDSLLDATCQYVDSMLKREAENQVAASSSSISEPKKIITVVCAAEEKVEVTAEVAVRSELIHMILQNLTAMGADCPVYLPEINASTLKLAVDFTQNLVDYHNDRSADGTMKRNFLVARGKLCARLRDDTDSLSDLIKAAEFLEMKILRVGLIEVKWYIMKGKRDREFSGIHKDYFAEEMKKIKKAE